MAFTAIVWEKKAICRSIYFYMAVNYYFFFLESFSDFIRSVRKVSEKYSVKWFYLLRKSKKIVIKQAQF